MSFFFYNPHHTFLKTPHQRHLQISVCRGGVIMTNEQKSTIESLRTSGQTFTAIADALGLSLNTVKSYCRRKADAPAQIESEYGVRCKQCGKPLDYKGDGKPRKFCSDRCRNEWWKKHPNDIHRKAFYSKTCAHCGKAYTVYGRPDSKFCSHACSSQHRRRHAEAGV